jgi:hypothetical protein
VEHLREIVFQCPGEAVRKASVISDHAADEGRRAVRGRAGSGFADCVAGAERAA